MCALTHRPRSYAEHVFKYAALRVFGVSIPSDVPLQWTRGRNSDLFEATLTVGGQVVLRVARAYGFRNIQGVLRKMKTGACAYHFVEIMACPSGCSNGGGQVRAPDASSSKALLEAVETELHDRVLRGPDANPHLEAVYREWLGGVPFSEEARDRIHTSYRAVPKLESGLVAKW